MSSRNYLVISSDMSLSDKKAYRMRALAAGLERCGLAKIGDIEGDVPGLQAIPMANKPGRVAHIGTFIGTGAWPKTIDERELAPLTDLVVAAAQDSWLTAALAAVGTAYTALNALVSPQMGLGRLMVCYGVSVESAIVPMPVSRLVFRRGGVAGNILAQFDMEDMGVRLEPDAFFSEPVVIDPNEVFAIQVLCRAIAPATRVHIHNFLYEGAGQTIA